MAKVKMTFSLDPESAERLRRTASRLDAPMSRVVAEAIDEYSARVGSLSERERERLLRAFDDLVPRIPERPVEEVREELAELRRARRAGGRLRRPEPDDAPDSEPRNSG